MMTKKILLVTFVCLWMATACGFPLDLKTTDETPVPESQSDFNFGKILEPFVKKSPTPQPSDLNGLEQADYLLFAGDLDSAIQQYQDIFESDDDENSKASALYGLGRSYYTRKDYSSAIDAFNRILGQFPNSDSAVDAYFMLGESYFDMEEYSQAASAYAKFVELKPGIIEDVARTYQGNAALSAGDFNQAIFAYQAALPSATASYANLINLQIGKSYAGMGDYTTAVQYYLGVYDSSEDDFTRATADLLTGQAYLELDMNEDAYSRLLDSVFQFPRAYDSYTALTILANNDVPVNPYYSGLVEYYAGSYDEAIRSFQQYLDSNPEDNDGSVYYFKGLSHYFSNQPAKAIAAYDEMINNYPANPYWPQAWDEKAYVQWAVLGQYTNAAETYQAFVSNAPSSPDAPNFLYEAGRTYERNDDLENAAATWQRMLDEYPSSDLSYRGLFLAGISYYRLGQFKDALSIFQRTLVLGANPADKAKSYLWIGKAYQSLGQPENARNAWVLASNADPTDYYSIRASEILNGADMFETNEGYDLGYDLATERPESESWLLSTFNLPAETDLSSLGELALNPSIIRIDQFYKLGLYKEAINEAEKLRGKLQEDIANTYRLMNFLVEHHLYQPAVYASRDILNQAGMDDLTSLTAPIYFTHIRFGAYFRELVLPIANEYDIPPLIFYSLIRQESMFNPYIVSSVGATGLGQMMPATGRESASLLGWPNNYEDSDLRMGFINLSLSAFYLDRVRNYLNGNLQAALVAYNAGPGNSEAWLSLSNGDPDLFLEILRAEETQNYLMQITEFLNIYNLVYSRPQ